MSPLSKGKGRVFVTPQQMAAWWCGVCQVVKCNPAAANGVWY
jgi:hypothetical protein